MAALGIGARVKEQVQRSENEVAATAGKEGKFYRVRESANSRLGWAGCGEGLPWGGCWS